MPKPKHRGGQIRKPANQLPSVDKLRAGTNEKTAAEKAAAAAAERGALAIVDDADRAFKHIEWPNLAQELEEAAGVCSCGGSGGKQRKTKKKRMIHFQIRSLLMADDKDWGTESHAWMQALMKGKESQLVDEPGAIAYWAAASLVLEEHELTGRLDNYLLYPCMQELKSGAMAGFRCRARLVRCRMGDHLFGDGKPAPIRTLEKATDMMQPITAYFPRATLDEVLEDCTPVTLLLLFKVTPDRKADTDQPAPPPSRARKALAHGLSFVAPTLRDYRGLRLVDKVNALRDHLKLAPNVPDEEMVTQSWMPKWLLVAPFAQKIDYLYDIHFPDSGALDSTGKQPIKSQGSVSKALSRISTAVVGGSAKALRRVSTAVVGATSSVGGNRKSTLLGKGAPGRRKSVFRRSVAPSGRVGPVNGVVPLGGHAVAQQRRGSVAKPPPKDALTATVDEMAKGAFNLSKSVLNLFAGIEQELDKAREEGPEEQAEVGHDEAAQSGVATSSPAPPEDTSLETVLVQLSRRMSDALLPPMKAWSSDAPPVHEEEVPVVSTNEQSASGSSHPTPDPGPSVADSAAKSKASVLADGEAREDAKEVKIATAKLLLSLVQAKVHQHDEQEERMLTVMANREAKLLEAQQAALASDAKSEAEDLTVQMKQLRNEEETKLRAMAKRSGDLLQEEKDAVAALEAAELAA